MTLPAGSPLPSLSETPVGIPPPASSSSRSSSSSATAASSSSSTGLMGRTVTPLLDVAAMETNALRCIYRLIFTPDYKTYWAEQTGRLTALLKECRYSASRPMPSDKNGEILSFLSLFEPPKEVTMGPREVNDFFRQCESIIHSFHVDDFGHLTPRVTEMNKTPTPVPTSFTYSTMIEVIRTIQSIFFRNASILKEGLFFTHQEMTHCFVIWPPEGLHIFINVHRLGQGSMGSVESGYHLAGHQRYAIKSCWHHPTSRMVLTAMEEEISTFDKCKRCIRPYPMWLQQPPFITFNRAMLAEHSETVWTGYVAPCYDGNLREWLKKKDITPLECIDICLKISSLFLTAQKHHLIVRDVKPSNLLFLYNREDKRTISTIVFADFGSSEFAHEVQEKLSKKFSYTKEFTTPEDLEGLEKAVLEKNGELCVKYAWNLFHFSIVASCYYVLTRGKYPYSRLPRTLNVTPLAQYGSLLMDIFKNLLDPKIRGFNLSLRQLYLALDDAQRRLMTSPTSLLGTPSAKEAADKRSFLAPPSRASMHRQTTKLFPILEKPRTTTPARTSATSSSSSSSSSATSPSLPTSTRPASGTRMPVHLVRFSREAVGFIFRLIFTPNYKVRVAEKTGRLKTLLHERGLASSQTPSPTELIEVQLFVSLFKSTKDTPSFCKEVDEFFRHCENIIQAFHIDVDGKLISSFPKGSRAMSPVPSDFTYATLLDVIRSIQQVFFRNNDLLKKGFLFTYQENIHCFALQQSGTLHLLTHIKPLYEGKGALVEKGYHLTRHQWYVIKRSMHRVDTPPEIAMVEELDTFENFSKKFTKSYPTWLQEPPIAKFIQAKVAGITTTRWTGYIAPFYESNLARWLQGPGSTTIARIDVCLNVLSLYLEAQKQNVIIRNVKPSHLFFNYDISGKDLNIVFGSIGGSIFDNELQYYRADFPFTKQFAHKEDLEGCDKACEAGNKEKFVQYSKNLFHFSIVASCFYILTGRYPYSETSLTVDVTPLVGFSPMIMEAFQRMLTPSLRRFDLSVEPLQHALTDHRARLIAPAPPSSSSSAPSGPPPAKSATPSSLPPVRPPAKSLRS